MRNYQSAPAPTFRVLLVLDDVCAAQEVVESFSRVALECHHIAGDKAVHDALTQVRPHLVLLDNTTDGRARNCLGRIQQSYRVPVILMTHEHGTSHDDALFHSLVEDYVLKPVDPKLLALRVIAHLRAMEPPEKVRVGRNQADWLPYGWSSCQACGFRGRAESFLRTTPLPGISRGGLGSEMGAGEPLILSGEKVGQPRTPSTYCDPVADELRRPIVCCPRCGHAGDVSNT